MGRIAEVEASTQQELEEYLSFLGWESNPFVGAAGIDEYVFPSEESIEDIVSHINNYTGYIVVHSRYSGVGKTTLARVLLEELDDTHDAILIPEHNVTPYELVSIVADGVGVGKSSSTKLTEQKLRNADLDEDVLLAVDEFGLNDPDSLHTLQFLNDEGFKLILTGMTSQWDAVGQIGAEGKAFRRRAGLEVELEPFDVGQARELYERRVSKVGESSLEPFITEDAFEVVVEESKGVPAVIVSALGEMVNVMSYLYAERGIETVTEEIARRHEYPDPEAE